MRRHVTIQTLAISLLVGWSSVAVAQQSRPASAPASAPSAPPATVEVVLKRYVEASGGEANFAKIKNRITRGSLEVPSQGLSGALTLYEAPPQQQHAVIEIRGIGKVENGCDGQTVYETSQMTGPRLMSGVEKAAALRQSRFNMALHLRELYPKIEFLGSEMIENRPSWKLALIPAEGKPEYWFFDQETGLQSALDTTVMIQGNEAPAHSVMLDYRMIDGLMLPFRTKQKIGNVEQVIVVDSVAHNTNIPKDAFDLPKDVQELVAKSASQPRGAQDAASKPAGAAHP